MKRIECLVVFILLGSLLGSCASTSSSGSPDRSRFAIAIHGGAGVISKSMPTETRNGYTASLESALRLGRDRLARGDSALDVCEAVVRQLEDDPRFNAGRGAVYTDAGVHELDASIMDGRTRASGAVTGVTTVRHPITLARHVMENSRHVLFSGPGAEKYADATRLERVENSFFDTERRRRQWQNRRRQEADRKKGTVGCVALDTAGNLAAATSTGGLTGKKFGRIGDTPIVGAGTYADNRTCAVSCTGTGEQFIRHTVARDIAARMEYGGDSLDDAARFVVFERLDPDDGGVIAVSKNGEIVFAFNCSGMFRGAADGDGRFEVKIWE